MHLPVAQPDRVALAPTLALALALTLTLALTLALTLTLALALTLALTLTCQSRSLIGSLITLESVAPSVAGTPSLLRLGARVRVWG